jgi:anthranilate synthase component 2
VILLVDNYDSFTWNLVQGLETLGAEVLVSSHDKIDSDRVSVLDPERIVISPGPGTPENSGGLFGSSMHCFSFSYAGHTI